MNTPNIQSGRVLLICLLVVGIGLTTGCRQSDPPPSDRNGSVSPSIDAPSALQQAWEAHGGLEAWSRQRQLQYTFEQRRGGTTARDHQLIDLDTRKVRIEGNEFVLGFDGEHAWVAPSLEAFPYGSSPRFYTSTYFYFFAMPFVLADPGAIATDVGTATVEGTTYNVTEIRYEEGVGDSPDDVYVVYTDADTHELGLVRFSVTYGDRPPSEPNTALVYTATATESGITLPVAGRYHSWNDESLGEPLGPEFRLTDVRFKTNTPNPGLFDMPEEAEIDSLPESN